MLRSDFNVPLAKDGSGVITDDGRIVASLPTIRALLDGGAKVVILAHLGRLSPGGIGAVVAGAVVAGTLAGRRRGLIRPALAGLPRSVTLALALAMGAAVFTAILPPFDTTVEGE